MKKINLFNRNTNLPSYRRRGIPFPWERGPAEQPGGMGITPSCSQCSQSTPSWKEGERKVPSYRGTGPRKNVPSFRGNAESPRCCRELVCGKTDGIPLFSGMTKKICHKFPSREGWRVAPAGVWFAALVALFIATPSFAEPTELDKKTVASKAYVDTKQDKITTGLVEFDDLGTIATVPALVLTNAAGTALNGNTIGFLDLETYNNLDAQFDELPDTLVPSIGLIDEQLQNIWNDMTALTWNSAETTSTNAYETKFVGDSGATANAWPSADRAKLINTTALAQGLALKQNKLPAKYTSTASVTQMGAKGGQTIELNTAGNVKRRYITAGGTEALTLKSGADNVILYINGTKTLEEFQISNFLNATGTQITENQNYIKGALVSLELLKDVYSALHTEIQNATPTGTPGNVAMYDASTGALGDGVATYDGSTTYNASTDADKIAVMSGVQRKKECGGYEPAPAGQPAHDGTHPGDEDYCWLWIFPD